MADVEVTDVGSGSEEISSSLGVTDTTSGAEVIAGSLGIVDTASGAEVIASALAITDHTDTTYGKDIWKTAGSAWADSSYSSGDGRPSIAVSSTGTIYALSLEVLGTTTLYLLTSTDNGVSWTPTTLKTGSIVSACIGIDPSDNLHVFWRTETNIIHRKPDTTEETVVTVDGSAYDSEISCYVDTNVYVAYCHNNDENTQSDIVLYSYTTSWAHETVTSLSSSYCYMELYRLADATHVALYRYDDDTDLDETDIAIKDGTWSFSSLEEELAPSDISATAASGGVTHVVARNSTGIYYCPVSAAGVVGDSVLLHAASSGLYLYGQPDISEFGGLLYVAFFEFGSADNFWEVTYDGSEWGSPEATPIDLARRISTAQGAPYAHLYVDLGSTQQVYVSAATITVTTGLAAGVDVVSIAAAVPMTESGSGTESLHVVRGSETEVRNHPHTSKWYLAVKEPRFIWAGTVSVKRDGMTITTSDGANESGFDIANFLPDCTAWISTSSVTPGHEHGRCRVKSVATTTLTVMADDSCQWAVGDTVYVTDLHELWPMPHRVVESGESYIVYKDWDIPASDRVEQPVPVFGPPACAFLESGTATVRFDGSRSYLVQPDSSYYEELGWTDNGITAWNWWLEGADSPTPSGKTQTATYSTSGQYVARLTVTGHNGETSIGFRNVYIFDRSTDPPITTFDIKSLSGTRANRGWNAEIDIFDTAFSPATLPNNAQVVLFAEEWFNGVAKTYTPDYSYLTGRENIKLLGWALDSAMDYDGVRRATMHISGLQDYISEMQNFPVYWTMSDDTAMAWSYFDPVTDDGLTVKKVLYHTIRWHWTLMRFTDVLLPDDHNNYVAGQNMPAGSLASQLDMFCEDIQADWAVTAGGGLHVFSWMNWLPVSGALSWIRESYPIMLDITTTDFTESHIEPRISRVASRVRIEGLITGDSGAERTSVDTVPGDITQFAGETVVKDSQVLGTGGGLPEGELTQGEELAGMVLAEESRRVEEVQLFMSGNYSCVDIVPESSHVTLTLAPNNFRNIEWTEKKFWVSGVTLNVDTKNMDVEVELRLLPETSITDVNGTALYSETEMIEFGSSSPAKSSFNSLIEVLDIADMVEIPALMGDPTGLVDGPDDYHVYVRLYGDNAQTVLAENDGLKPIADRPVTVEVRNKRSAKPGNSLYTVARVRKARGSGDYIEGSGDYDRAYTSRVAVFHPSRISASATPASAPLLVMGASLYAYKISLYATTAPTGADLTVTIKRNGSTLGTATIADGDHSSSVAIAATLIDDDRLDCYIDAVGSTVAGKDLTVQIACREYGV